MQWIDRCLGSVYASELPLDAFVVDNASTDGTAGYVRDNFPQATLVCNASNLGFAEGNNVGFRHALENGYDYVYLLNQDAWIEPSTVSELVRLHSAHPEFGILSPVQMCADGVSCNPVFAAEVIPSMKTCDTDAGLSEVPFVMAAHWFMPVETIRKAGLFAELFPIYGNDDNYCHRVLYHGLKIGVAGNLKAVHDKQYAPRSKDSLIYRNYYIGSLVALADIRRPLAFSVLFVLALTLVKSFRYRSLLTFRYLRKIFGREDFRAVKALRRDTSL